MQFLQSSGLAPAGSAPLLTPLTGGVASDIWKVEGAGDAFVVKRALPQLRVAQLWNAPISRNASEVAWLLEAGSVAAEAVPKILADDKDAGIFAMSYFEPRDHPVWKHELQAGRVDPAFGDLVGRTIAAIHSATANAADVAARFANDDTFLSIRIEPYLGATARVHPDLAAPLLALARETMACKLALVHGDVSPKNILVGGNGPVFLDAECAWYGDPAFDLAFCLNHLLLKCVNRPASRDALLASFDRLAASYLQGVTWEPADGLESRAARLLPALLLARVDGKSPVEYITADVDKDLVRRIARPLIAAAPHRLADIKNNWAGGIWA